MIAILRVKPRRIKPRSIPPSLPGLGLLPRGPCVPLQDGSEVRSLMPGDEQGLTCRAALLWWKSYSKSKKSRGRAIMSWLWSGNPHPSCLRKSKPTFVNSLPSLYHRYHSSFSVCCASSHCPGPLAGQYQSSWQIAKAHISCLASHLLTFARRGKGSRQTFRAWRVIGLRLQKPVESRSQLQWFVSAGCECLCPFLQWRHPTGSLTVTVLMCFLQENQQIKRAAFPTRP